MEEYSYPENVSEEARASDSAGQAEAFPNGKPLWITPEGHILTGSTHDSSHVTKWAEDYRKSLAQPEAQKESQESVSSAEPSTGDVIDLGGVSGEEKVSKPDMGGLPKEETPYERAERKVAEDWSKVPDRFHYMSAGAIQIVTHTPESIARSIEDSKTDPRIKPLSIEFHGIPASLEKHKGKIEEVMRDYIPYADEYKTETLEDQYRSPLVNLAAGLKGWFGSSDKNIRYFTDWT